MSSALRRPMTLADFLDWEARQSARWEFDGIAPVAMTGTTRAHAVIQSNLALAVGARLRGGRCRFLGPSLKIEAAGSIRYPDGFIVCTPGGRTDTVVRDPVVVFEIISPGTQRTDRIVKAREYRDTPSVQRYVILEQDQAAATVFAREGERWLATLSFAGDRLAMPEIGLELPLDELYEGVELAPPEAEEAAL
jgi:Uma2 family endonuclease